MLRSSLIALVLTIAPISSVFAQGDQKRYDATWASLDTRAAPAWYLDAKFGIFIHWGVYAVPSFSTPNEYAEWYWYSLQAKPGTDARDRKRHDDTVAFHERVYGKDFAYTQFAPMFKAELFDPDDWARILKGSGARYVALTSKHHDGFCLFQSAEANRDWGRPWNAVDIGPRRDLLGDLSTSVRKAGLKMGFYYSLYEWFNPLWLADRQLYVDKHMIPQFKDVVTRYKPSIIFSDGEWDMPSAEWKSPELLAWLYNESPVKDEVIVNDRWGKETRHHHGGYSTTGDRAAPPAPPHPWEENRGMGFSYGYNRAEQINDYRTDRELVLMLVDLVSRGGNLVLDIGPTGDGRIPVIMQERLEHLGRWLKVNGEEIYGTKAWTSTRQWSAGERSKLNTGEFMTRYEVTDYVDRKKPGQAIIECFSTSKGNDVYAIIPGWPGNRLELRSVSAPAGMKPVLLGASGGTLQWSKSGDGITIDLPP